MTIGICTHDRPDLLLALLRALAPDAARHGVEIIVVDSASEPPIGDRIATIATTATAIRVIRLDRPGVSLARNAILVACATPWLAFIDDDEMPGAGWLDAALALVDRLPGHCGACGGNVIPRWPGPAPRLSRRASRYLSLIDHAGEYDQTAAPHFGIGHAIVRMAAMRDVGGFDPRLGRDGTTLLSGEESDLVDLLADRRWRVWHSDTIIVEHLIPRERIERPWLIDRAFWEGVSVARRLSRHAERMNGLIRVVQRRRALLQSLAPMLGAACDADLRLAFVNGVLAEHSLSLHDTATANSRMRPAAENDVPILSP